MPTAKGVVAHPVRRRGNEGFPVNCGFHDCPGIARCHRRAVNAQASAFLKSLDHVKGVGAAGIGNQGTLRRRIAKGLGKRLAVARAVVRNHDDQGIVIDVLTLQEIEEIAHHLEGRHLRIIVLGDEPAAHFHDFHGLGIGVAIHGAERFLRYAPRQVGQFVDEQVVGSSPAVDAGHVGESFQNGVMLHTAVEGGVAGEEPAPLAIDVLAERPGRGFEQAVRGGKDARDVLFPAGGLSMIGRRIVLAYGMLDVALARNVVDVVRGGYLGRKSPGAQLRHEVVHTFPYLLFKTAPVILGEAVAGHTFASYDGGKAHMGGFGGGNGVGEPGKAFETRKKMRVFLHDIADVVAGERIQHDDEHVG